LVRAPRTSKATSTSLMIRLASVAPRLRASDRTRMVAPALKGAYPSLWA
jgi:hypothetical protein